MKRKAKRTVKRIAWGRIEDILEEDAKAAHRSWTPKTAGKPKRKG